jgi:hypothetical protein
MRIMESLKYSQVTSTFSGQLRSHLNHLLFDINKNGSNPLHFSHNNYTFAVRLRPAHCRARTVLRYLFDYSEKTTFGAINGKSYWQSPSGYNFTHTWASTLPGVRGYALALYNF